MRIPRDEIQENTVVPDGVYLVRIEELEKSATKGSEGAKLPAGVKMFNLTARIKEPKEFAGLALRDNFCVGTEDDPDALDPETWKSPKAIGCMRFEKLLKAAKIQSDDDDEDAQPNIMSEIEGQECLAQAVYEKDDGSRDPRYKGRERNRISGWYPIGDRDIGVEGGAKRPGTSKRPASPVPRKIAPPAQAQNTQEPGPDENTPEAQATAPAPRRTLPRRAALPAVKEAEVEVVAGPDEIAGEDVSANPTKAPPPVRAKRATKPETTECGMCEPPQDIPSEQYRAHILLHTDAKEE